MFRFIASLGMGGEWALGVALVTEMWPDRSRALMAGLIGAAANVGYLIVGLISLVLVSFIEWFGHLLLNLGISQQLVETLVSGEGWRLMMIVGALPALLMFFIMRIVPESHKWEAERDKGATSHWATRDLLGVLIGAIGASAVVVMWSPAFQLLSRHVRVRRKAARRLWARRKYRPRRVVGARNCGRAFGIYVSRRAILGPCRAGRLARRG